MCKVNNYRAIPICPKPNKILKLLEINHILLYKAKSSSFLDSDTCKLDLSIKVT